jgi:hypothetical protein
LVTAAAVKIVFLDSHFKKNAIDAAMALTAMLADVLPAEEAWGLVRC